MVEPLLDVTGLKTHFVTDRGVVRAVDGVSLHINAGETLGVVGESGSGKSVTALSIMRLIREPPGRIAAGEIRYNGVNLLDLSAEQMRKIRGKEIAMIFQEPMTSLNPVFTVGEQIAEVDPVARGAQPPRCRGQERRDAPRRPHSEPRAAGQGISAPVVRRHAPAGHDRDGAVLQSETADRRRADDGARRHHPGADSGSAQ